jgi:hypothetical protein
MHDGWVPPRGSQLGEHLGSEGTRTIGVCMAL